MLCVFQFRHLPLVDQEPKFRWGGQDSNLQKQLVEEENKFELVLF